MENVRGRRAALMALSAAVLCGSGGAVLGQSAIRVDLQAKCPGSGVPMVVLANTAATGTAAGSGQVACVLLDGASFTIDVSTSPPTLRIKVVTPPVPTPTVVLPGFADAEVPGGAVDGSNAVFTLAHAPSPAGSLLLVRNGLVLQQGVDYTVSGSTVTFQANLPNGSAVPESGDGLQGWYRYAAGGN